MLHKFFVEYFKMLQMFCPIQMTNRSYYAYNNSIEHLHYQHTCTMIAMILLRILKSDSENQ